MSILEFQCYNIHLDHDDDLSRFSVSDNDDDPSNYLIMEYSKSPNEQDICLGQDTYYVEVNGQQYSQYGGVDLIKIYPNSMDILFYRKSRIGMIFSNVFVKFPDIYRINLIDFFKYNYKDEININIL